MVLVEHQLSPGNILRMYVTIVLCCSDFFSARQYMSCYISSMIRLWLIVLVM